MDKYLLTDEESYNELVKNGEGIVTISTYDICRK
jgi:hypothetical protein